MIYVTIAMGEGEAKADHKNAPSASSTPESYSKGGGGGGGGALRAICGAIFTVLILLGIIALILWLVYRPHKPRLTVVGAAIYDLNFTAPPLISTSVQFSVLARNPNRRVSIHYDKLSMYVTYKDQIITPPLPLPPLRLGHKSTVVIAPVMGGNGIPVSPEVANGLKNDEAYGVVLMRVVILGRLRWKAGAIKTGRYGFYARCDVWLRFNPSSNGQVPLLAPSTCKVDV
ncbi:harpin-induced family protein [Arabidopsis lyrata subsp. lyrata]|uniref:Harpin-induced family protein n=2 Tax=Arabidopsis lyrata subsp. lyrata TaxID=81972 RepID=D7M4W2_ARALL|nr:harpin-induced family protein [Arabidopsis lyrata subsp. lyrata]